MPARAGDLVALPLQVDAVKLVASSSMLTGEIGDLLGVLGQQRIIQRECHDVLQAH